MKVKFYEDAEDTAKGGYVGVKSGKYEDLIHQPETLKAAVAALYKASTEHYATDSILGAIIGYELTALASGLDDVYGKWLSEHYED